MSTLAFIGGIGPWELAIILVIVLILFGAGRLPEVFASFGKGVKAFRDAQRDDSIDVTPEGRKELSSDPVMEHERERERTKV